MDGHGGVLSQIDFADQSAPLRPTASPPRSPSPPLPTRAPITTRPAAKFAPPARAPAAAAAAGTGGGLFAALDWYAASDTPAGSDDVSAPVLAPPPPEPIAAPAADTGLLGVRGGGALAGAAETDADLREAAVGRTLGDRARQFAAGALTRLGDALHFLVSAPVEKWVHKAVTDTPGPPKWKYVRRLVVYAWDASTARDAGMTNSEVNLRLSEALLRLPLHESAAVACKAALLLLRLAQEGPPQTAGEMHVHGFGSVSRRFVLTVAVVWRWAARCVRWLNSTGAIRRHGTPWWPRRSTP
jgi:hypothetical protein